MHLNYILYVVEMSFIKHMWSLKSDVSSLYYIILALGIWFVNKVKIM